MTRRPTNKQLAFGAGAATAAAFGAYHLHKEFTRQRDSKSDDGDDENPFCKIFGFFQTCLSGNEKAKPDAFSDDPSDIDKAMKMVDDNNNDEPVQPALVEADDNTHPAPVAVADNTQVVEKPSTLVENDNSKTVLATVIDDNDEAEQDVVEVPAATTIATSTITCTRIVEEPSTDLVPTSAITFKTPSPTRKSEPAKAVAYRNSIMVCREKVVEASEAITQALYYPAPIQKKVEQIMRVVSNTSKLQEKKKKKVAALLKKDPSLLKKRAIGFGATCPDGCTPLMAAAFGGQVEAAKIVLEAAEGKFDDLLQDRNVFGQTAIAIAAAGGNLEMVNFLAPLYGLADDGKTLLSPPLDAIGQTPLGNVITSPNPKARSNKKALEERLFSPEDPSVQGKYHPVEDRMTIPSSSDVGVAFGTSEMPGRRISMEDAMCTESWTQDFGNGISVDLVLLGVCDGHGDGGLVSSFVAENTKPILSRFIEEMSGRNAVDFSSFEFWSKVWTSTSIEIDAKLKKEKLEGGSTAVFTLLCKDYIITANTGDSRAIIARTDGVKPLSFDHKPEDIIETARVEAAGMRIAHLKFVEDGVEKVYHKVAKGESNSNTMSVSRAYGDFDYKGCKQQAAEGMSEEDIENLPELPPEEQPLTCVPDVTVHKRQHGDDLFLVLACDGIWDVMSNEEASDFVKMQAKLQTADKSSVALLPEVGDALLQECLRKGSLDNMSTIVVSLQPSAADLVEEEQQQLAPKILEF